MIVYIYSVVYGLTSQPPLFSFTIAIIVTLITPFSSTISSGNNDLIAGIRDIFVAEMLSAFEISLWLFRSNYEPCGEDQGIPFSDVAAISSYIPEVRSHLFSYPLLAVDTDCIGDELYEWSDPDRAYSYYDLTRDARQILKDCMMPEDEFKSLFSVVKHWPPTNDEGVPSNGKIEKRAGLCQ